MNSFLKSVLNAKPVKLYDENQDKSFIDFFSDRINIVSVDFAYARTSHIKVKMHNSETNIFINEDNVDDFTVYSYKGFKVNVKEKKKVKKAIDWAKKKAFEQERFPDLKTIFPTVEIIEDFARYINTTTSLVHCVKDEYVSAIFYGACGVDGFNLTVDFPCDKDIESFSIAEKEIDWKKGREKNLSFRRLIVDYKKNGETLKKLKNESRFK